MLARGEGQEASRRAGGLQPHGVMTVAIILTQLGRSFLFLTRRYCWFGAGILSVFATLHPCSPIPSGPSTNRTVVVRRPPSSSTSPSWAGLLILAHGRACCRGPSRQCTGRIHNGGHCNTMEGAMICSRIASAAVFAVLLLPISSFAQTPAPPTVTVAKPVVKDIVEWDDFIGRFEAIDEVEIRARVSGYLEKVLFTDGALVKEGDPLFTIDQRPYQAALEQAEATVASAQVRVEFASNDFERAESLRRSNNIAEQLLDQRRSNYLTARAELDRAQAALRNARLDLEFTEIKAPLAGRISRKLVSVGNLVNANQTILTNIVSLDPIHFYFDVDERSYLAYSRQMAGGTRTSTQAVPNQVQLTMTDERQALRMGRLDFVDNRLDAASGTIRARAVFENKDLFLTPGLFGRVSVGGSDPYKGVLVPDESVGSDQDRRIVYVIGDDNSVMMRPVRPGPRIDGYRVIRSGLKGDETVVINGLARIRPGIKVTPQMSTLPPIREAMVRNLDD
jgi:RND family efflux transporter MFP subunit